MEEIWLSRMTKKRFTNSKNIVTTQKANKIFDNTAIADQQDGKME